MVASIARRYRSLEVAEQPLGGGDRFRLVGDDDVDDAVGLLHRNRPDLVGVDIAEPTAGDHGRAAHPDRRIAGGHDQVGGARDDSVAREAAALHDRDARHHTRQPRPQLECARLEGRHRRKVGVTGPTTAALGEEDGRQPHPLDQLEQPVLLAVPEITLGAREDGVVVGQHRAGAALVAEEVAVDARGACHQTIGGCARDQIVELPAEPLGGDGEPAVLDERAGVDEIVDVLAGGSTV